MNVTLSIDDQVLARARELAHRRGTSLNQIIRDYLEGLTSEDPSRVAAELERLWSEEEGASGGWTWNREEVYAGCKILYSEDLQHGRRIDGLEIANPFHELEDHHERS